MIVEIVAAYVEGRPMPSSSRVFTSEASVYRAGGVVVCPSAVTSEASRASPSAITGRRLSSSFAPFLPESAVRSGFTSRPSSYAARNPGR